MNIIIPIGGVGQRFKDEGYDLPKPLISVLGKPMIYQVINSLNLTNNDVIYIVYHNHLKEFNFETLVKFYFPKINIKFVSLDYLTKGAAETVLRGLETFTENELKDNVLLLDCDTFYNDDIIDKYKSQSNKNTIFYFNSTDPKPIYSYITLKDNKVTDIKEKIKISDNANTGAYGFENGDELKQYCNKVLGLDKEVYISCVYEEMLKDDKIIYGREIDSFNCVGTPLQLKTYCNKYKETSSPLRVCFDLDNTLVTHPTIHGDYSSVLPIQRNIDYLNLLHRLGHTIIIYTARRFRTHSGNVGAIVADIGKVTFDTLDKFNIPYDEIFFGKPYAQYYIDDLAVNANSSLDKALGIYNTDIAPRSFNKVEYTNSTVIKHTSNEGEVYWYKNIPESLQRYFPKVVSIQNNRIELERIDGVSYSYLYTNKQLTQKHLFSLVNALDTIHSSNYPFSVNVYNIYSNYSRKLYQRITEYPEIYAKYNIVDLLLKIIHSLQEYENKKEGLIGVIHGDPVFTNVFETPTGIKFIDMRGKQGDEVTLYGDIYYDLAKVYQSLIGYDNILNGIEINDAYRSELVTYFESMISEEALEKIKLITASLLISMLPLHDEDENKFNKYIKLIEWLRQ
jgi:capsule biosynthesis phosphatase